MDIAVIGAGNGGQATAAYLGTAGHRVRLFDRFEETLADVATTRQVSAVGAFHAEVELDAATTDLPSILPGADIILVTIPGFALDWVARTLAPHLHGSELVVLHPGGVGGALEVRRVWDELQVPSTVLLAETDTLVFACRLLRPGLVDVKAVKRRLLIAALPAARTGEALRVMQALFPATTAASSVLETSVGTLNPVIHPAITLANVGTLERRDVPFDFYGEGVTDSIARLLATVDRERMTIAEALGAPAMSLLEWASIVYGVEAPDLVELYRRLAALVYQGIGTPPDLAARYVTEDVPLGLVPLLALGAIAGVDTPTISGLVSILGALTGTDFGGTGRTAARMGINDLSAADLRRSVGVDGSDRVEPGAHGMAGSTA